MLLSPAAIDFHPRMDKPLLLSSCLAIALLKISVFVGCVICQNLESDTRALEAFRDAVGGPTLKWANRNACNWTGVRCQAGRVVFLSLPAAGLLGTIPPLTLGNLTALRILRLRYNSLQGFLPTDLLQCRELRTLYLQKNQLQGSLFQNLSQWQNLVRLNLAQNNFTGTLPAASLKQLRRLRTLLLHHNGFTGELPDLDLPHLDQFNVSDNNFTGQIPNSLRKYVRSAFLNNAGLCGGPLVACQNSTSNRTSSAPPPSSPTTTNSTPPTVINGSSNKHSAALIAGVAAGAGIVVGLCLLGLCFMFIRKRRSGSGASAAAASKGPKGPLDSSTSREFEYSSSVPDSSGDKKLVFLSEQPKAFGLEDLLRASAEVLGRGTLGTSYKALLEVGSVVVVKRLKEIGVGPRQFTQQMAIVGRLSHKNLLVLKAYYYSGQEKLLVSEYLPMGSLSSLLHGSRGSGHTLLNWEARVRIALGAAEGIEYIHRQGSRLAHGNIKSSNVLLTEEYNACVSDYGLIQMANPNSAVGRKVGYRAPEVTEIRAITQKADVYSFGVLLLEMLTGRAPTQASLSDEGVDLPRWVQSVVKEEWTAEVFDLDLMKQQPAEEDMVQLLQTAMACVREHPDERPTMTEVVQMIRAIPLRSS